MTKFEELTIKGSSLIAELKLAQETILTDVELRSMARRILEFDRTIVAYKQTNTINNQESALADAQLKTANAYLGLLSVLSGIGKELAEKYVPGQ